MPLGESNKWNGIFKRNRLGSSIAWASQKLGQAIGRSLRKESKRGLHNGSGTGFCKTDKSIDISAFPGKQVTEQVNHEKLPEMLIFLPIGKGFCARKRHKKRVSPV